MKVIGFEAANSFVKIKSERGEDAYLNTLRERHDLGEDIFGEESAPKEFFKYNDIIYTKGDTRNMQSSSARDSDRYATEEFKIESLIAIAQHVDNGDQVKVITGLPAKDYKNQKTHDTIARQLLGQNTVWVGKEPRTFEVMEVRTILQPLGTYTFLLMNEDGSLKEQGLKLSRQNKVIIDIGFGTTDVAILEGGEMVDHFGIGVSMFDVYDRMLTKLGLKNSLSHLQMERLVRQAEKEKKPLVIEYGGREYEAEDIKKESMRIVAGRIITGLKNRVSLDSYDAAIFAGGGVLALYDHLKVLLEEIPNAVPVKHPQMSNARGFYIYGKYKK